MKKIFLTLAALTLAGQACIQVSRSGGDGGIFKSNDFGDSWEQKIFVGQEKNRVLTIANVNVTDLVIDPSDPRTIYIGTRENGAFTSSDGAEKWRPMLTDKGEVKALAVDPKNRRTLYALLGEKIVKSDDGGKIWNLIYSEPRQQPLTEIQVDNFDSRRIYAGVATGELIKSFDAGQSWSLLKKFDSSVQKIIINPKDTRIIYAGTSRDGIYKSVNGGVDWLDLKDKLKAFDRSLDFQDLAINTSQTNLLIYASNYGLLKSTDGGDSWQDIKLLTPPGTVTIFSVAINNQNPNEIIYGTGQNLFKTRDGGNSWISRPLPTSRVPNQLIVDPTNSQLVYFAALRIKR